MALLFMDGFETAPNRKPGWQFSGGTTNFQPGRNGGMALGYLSPDNKISFPASAQVVAGAAFQTSITLTASNRYLMALWGDGGLTRHLAINMNENGYLQLNRGTGAILATATTNPIQMLTWFYLEMKATIHDSAGTCVVRLNGQEVINFTGDTKNAGTSTNIDTFSTYIDQSSWGRIDDLYILNTLGSAPYNDFLGDIKIEAIRPSANGAASQFVGSDGNSVDNYQLTDDPAGTANMMADYVASSTVGNQDLYELGNLSTSTGTVLAVQTTVFGQKSDAGAGNIKILQRDPAGTVTASASLAMTTTPTPSSLAGDIRIAAPDGTPWDFSKVNSLQTGIEVS